jgi:GTP-binding protein HflX
LDIFASHAKTREAKTQVELAQLQYMLPRLNARVDAPSKQYGALEPKSPAKHKLKPTEE